MSWDGIILKMVSGSVERSINKIKAGIVFVFNAPPSSAVPQVVVEHSGRKQKQIETDYEVSDGTFESALMIIKDIYDGETLQVGASDFWQPVESKACFTVEEACEDYCEAKVGHIRLAEMLLLFFPGYESGVKTGDIDPDKEKRLIKEVSDALLLKYPESYRLEVQKRKNAKLRELT